MNIGAVDTHRPKPKTSNSSSSHLTPTSVSINSRSTNAGASGEIVMVSSYGIQLSSVHHLLPLTFAFVLGPDESYTTY